MDEHSGSVRRVSYLLILVFIIAAAGIIAAGVISYGRFHRHHMNQEKDQLHSITALKISELTQWRQDCLRSAGVFYQNPAFSSMVKEFFANPKGSAAGGHILSWLQKVCEGSSYDRISLLDGYGRTRLAVPDSTAAISFLVAAQAREAMKTGQVSFVDFHRNEYDNRIYLSILVPVLDNEPGGAPLGVVSLRIDPERYLYPYINRWPTPSRTAETLIIRREGGYAVYLNELKFRKNTALTLRFPLTDRSKPAVRAVLGYTGIVEGKDYRNRPVLACIQPVPGSPWFLVARIDLDEVNEPMRERLWLIALFAVALLLAAGAALGYLWRRQLVMYYRESLLKEQELRSAEGRFLAIYQQSPIAIELYDGDGTLRGANPACLALFGVDREGEIRGFSLFDDPNLSEERKERLRQGMEVRYEAPFDFGMVHELSLYSTSRQGIIWLDVLISPLRETAGQPGYLVQVLDITEKKRFEQALRASEEKYRLITETIMDVILTTDSEGVYSYISQAHEKVLGRGEEVLGRSVFEHIHPDDIEITAEIFQDALVRKTVGRAEYRYVHPERGYIWLESQGMAAEINGKVTGVIASRDITDRKRAEEALRESETRVRRKLDAILEPEGDIGTLELADIVDHEAVQSLMDDFHKVTGIGIAIVDLRGSVLVATGWQDICTKFHRVHPGTLEGCRESDLTLTAGVEPGAFKIYRCKNNMWDIATPIIVGGAHLGNLFLGQFFFEGEVPDLEVFRLQARRCGFDEKEYLSALARVPRFTRETIDAAMTFYAKFGGMISRLSYANIKLARTIQERDSLLDSLRRSEQALVLERDNLRGIMDAFNDGICIMDQDYSLQYVNPVIKQLFGPVGGRECHQYFHGLTAPCPWCRNDEVMAGRSVTWEWESPGNGRIYEIFEAPFRNPDGSVSKIEFFHDVTDRKRAEQELREKNTELERFTYMISHDLKSPLVTVKTFLGYLAQDLEKSDRERIESDMRFMGIAADKMGQLLDELLEMSRIGRLANPPANVSFSELASEAVSLVAGRISERGVAVTIHDADVELHGDRARLGEIWQNLVENAVKFMGGQGSPSIEIGVDLAGETPEFFVSDNGMGIEPRFQGKIFGLFEKLDAAGEGTGLGLALVKRIVELYQGSIAVRSEGPGKGARFLFTLPGAVRRNAGTA